MSCMAQHPSDVFQTQIQYFGQAFILYSWVYWSLPLLFSGMNCFGKLHKSQYTVCTNQIFIDGIFGNYESKVLMLNKGKIKWKLINGNLSRIK